MRPKYFAVEGADLKDSVALKFENEKLRKLCAYYSENQTMQEILSCFKNHANVL